MSSKVDQEKYNRMLDGLHGSNAYKARSGALPSKSQLAYIDALVEELEGHGIEARSLVESSIYYKHMAEAKRVINALLQLKRKHHIFTGPARILYTNLCREKETGKKIKYKTTKFCAAPVGYEFIGQLSREIIEPEAVS